MFNFNLSNPVDLEIKSIQNVISKYAILFKINKHISKKTNLCKLKMFNTKKYDFIFDGLNIEEGTMNSFCSIRKILDNQKNKLSNKKILIVIIFK